MNADSLILDAPLNPDLAVFRDSMRKYLATVPWRASARRSLDTGAPCWRPDGWRQACDATGMGALTIPAELGGAGFTLAEASVVSGELGYALAGLPWFACVALAAGALLECAEAAPAKTLLTRIASGESTATLAGLEQAFTRPMNLPTATLDGTTVLVDGLCRGVLDAPTARSLLVFCRPDDWAPSAPLSLVLLEAGCAGITVAPRKTLDASRPLGDVSVSQARGQVVGMLTGLQVEKIWETASVLLARELLGSAQFCIEMTIAYLKIRRQFGQLIGEFQALQHRCADVYMKLDGARAATAYAIQALLSDAEDRTQAVAAAKLQANEAARFAVEETIQLHGGIGYTWEHEAHLYFRRVKSSALMLGDDDFLRGRIATALGV